MYELCSNSGDTMNLNFGEKFEKLLGMWWSPKDDCFTYVVKYTKITEDILNDLRRTGCGWDEQIDESQALTWFTYLKSKT
uniref:CSON008567 protein n=1 Tax=Culicoides sonorensis TaxID=179676 RepID=A0A336N007_CULSO